MLTFHKSIVRYDFNKEVYMQKVTVIDKRCSTGKSQGMVKDIKNSVMGLTGEKFLYITPYLEQCHTLAGTEPISEYDDRPKRDKDGVVIYKETEFNLAYARFKHPDNRNSEGTKQESLKRLMANGEHIVSTHKLFLEMKLDTLNNADKYTLVLDETLDIFETCNLLSSKQASKLLKLNILRVLDDGITLQFDRNKFGDELEDGEDAVEDTHYEELAVLCDNKQLMLVNGHVIMWEFSSEIIKKFKKVYILTYLFEGREMSVYLKKHGIDYVVEKGISGGKDIAHLVEILYDDKLNAVGDNDFALSVSRTRRTTNGKKHRGRKEPIRDNYDSDEKFKRTVSRYQSYIKNCDAKLKSADETADTLRRNLHTVMSARWGAKAGDRYFTCLESNKEFIAGKNYKNDWLAFSIKATNMYKDKHHIAFLMNIFMQPTIKQVCDGTDFEVDEDLVCLSHLIQFMYRSALRKNEKIKIYIPSSRMRGLLQDYLDGVYD